MAKHSYLISIEANESADAITKYNALNILAQKLSAKELKRLAEVVEKEPLKTAMAKKALGL